MIPPLPASSRRLAIAFVTVADLPEGGGNTSRLKTLAASLCMAGHDITIWNQHCLGPASEAALRPRGLLSGGARFEYVLGTTRRHRGIGALWMKMGAILAVLWRVVCARVRGRLDVLWLNQLSFYDGLPLTIFAKLLGLRLIQSFEDERHALDSSERASWSSKLFGLNERLADRLLAPLADAVVVISHYLKDKYERLGCRRVTLIPTIVDCAAWHCPCQPSGDPPRRFLYSGMFGDQDELEGLLDAFAQLRAEGHRFTVALFGRSESSADRVRRVREHAEQCGLSAEVTFPGFLPLEQIRREVCSADVLLNVRRGTAWSSSGLSTKLSEYLASGRPVITSSVGDVARYLADGESARVVPPDAGTQALAAVLRDCLEATPAELARLGAGGASVARSCFDMSAGRTLTDALLASLYA